MFLLFHRHCRVDSLEESRMATGNSFMCMVAANPQTYLDSDAGPKIVAGFSARKQKS